MNNRKEFLVQIVKEAQSMILRKLEANYAIDIKGGNKSDLVTEVDVEIEKFLVAKIKEEYPNDGFITEENTVPIEASDYVWIIDPIDGTMNFVYMLRDFAISVGLYHKGIGKVGVICDVVNDEMIVGELNKGVSLNGKAVSKLEPVSLRESIVDVSLRTIVGLEKKGIADLTKMSSSILSHRNMGSAALRIAHIALGRIHMYISDTLCIWDFAAGLVILNELGGYHNFMDEEIKFDSNRTDLLAANNKEILDQLKENYYFK